MEQNEPSKDPPIEENGSQDRPSDNSQTESRSKQQVKIEPDPQAGTSPNTNSNIQCMLYSIEMLCQNIIDLFSKISADDMHNIMINIMLFKTATQDLKRELFDNPRVIMKELKTLNKHTRDLLAKLTEQKLQIDFGHINKVLEQIKQAIETYKSTDFEANHGDQQSDKFLYTDTGEIKPQRSRQSERKSNDSFCSDSLQDRNMIGKCLLSLHKRQLDAKRTIEEALRAPQFAHSQKHPSHEIPEEANQTSGRILQKMEDGHERPRHTTQSNEATTPKSSEQNELSSQTIVNPRQIHHKMPNQNHMRDIVPCRSLSDRANKRFTNAGPNNSRMPNMANNGNSRGIRNVRPRYQETRNRYHINESANVPADQQNMTNTNPTNDCPPQQNRRNGNHFRQTTPIMDPSNQIRNYPPTARDAVWVERVGTAMDGDYPVIANVHPQQLEQFTNLNHPISANTNPINQMADPRCQYRRRFVNHDYPRMQSINLENQVVSAPSEQGGHWEMRNPQRMLIRNPANHVVSAPSEGDGYWEMRNRQRMLIRNPVNQVVSAPSGENGYWEMWNRQRMLIRNPVNHVVSAPSEGDGCWEMRNQQRMLTRNPVNQVVSAPSGEGGHWEMRNRQRMPIRNPANQVINAPGEQQGPWINQFNEGPNTTHRQSATTVNERQATQEEIEAYLASINQHDNNCCPIYNPGRFRPDPNNGSRQNGRPFNESLPSKQRRTAGEFNSDSYASGSLTDEEVPRLRDPSTAPPQPAQLEKPTEQRKSQSRARKVKANVPSTSRKPSSVRKNQHCLETQISTNQPLSTAGINQDETAAEKSNEADAGQHTFPNEAANDNHSQPQNDWK